MKITADSMVCEIKHGESLLDAVKKLDLDMMSLASRPLAAQIGGEYSALDIRRSRTWTYICSAIRKKQAGGYTNARCNSYLLRR